MLVHPHLGARTARWLGMLALGGCADTAPPPPTPKAADAPTTPATPTTAKPPTPTDAKPATPTPTPAATTGPTGEDWRVWFSQGGQWVTRWIDATATTSTLVAEKRGDAKAAKAAYETSLALRDNETVRKALARLR